MRLLITLTISLVVISTYAQKNSTMKKGNCDPVTGVCTPASLDNLNIKEDSSSSSIEIIYIGDPMCSWCWGISKELIKLRDYQDSTGGNFKLVMGGLRPGGGDEWNDEFKGFLKHHWEEVYDRSGQSFGTKLFEQDSFNYDTEPSCRAVVAARPYLGEKELEFFEAVQKKFYVDNEDPNLVTYYESICNDFGIDYTTFKQRFESKEVKEETHQEFVLNRSWGVRGYPSVIAKVEDKLYRIANGYSTFEQMKTQVELVKKEVEAQ